MVEQVEVNKLAVVKLAGKVLKANLVATIEDTEVRGIMYRKVVVYYLERYKLCIYLQML